MTARNTDVESRIIFEDNHLIIVNKLPRELVQGDDTGDATLADAVKAYIKESAQKPGSVFLGIPHRLDRPVGGAVIFAKTSKALARMSEMFRIKSINKTYWAIVENPPEKTTGTLENSLLKNHQQNKSYVVATGRKGSKVAILHYKQTASADNYHLLEVNLETGRHHQIRAQLANAGCVIKGDLKYGAKRSNGDGSISLHSRHTSFVHPIKKIEINVTAWCPQDQLWQYFEAEMNKN